MVLYWFPQFQNRQAHPENLGGRSKLDRNTVHAVALISRSLEAFSSEHMAQMPTTSCTCDFYPPAVRIRLKEGNTIVSTSYKEMKVQKHSVKWLLNRTDRFMAPGSPSKNAGQPQPESNLVVDLYRGVPQPAQLYTPSL